MKNVIHLLTVAVCISILGYTYAVSPLSLKQLSADYILDNKLLKEQNEQKVQQVLERLPEDLQCIIKERILACYKLQLFSALSIKTIPPHMSLHGHTSDRVTSAAFSPGGRYVLTGFWNKTARIWDLHNLAAKPVVLIGHTNTVTSAAFSPNGRYALTGSKDRTARLWDLHKPTGELVVLKGHTGGITSVALSPDGKYALTGSYDGTACLWNLHNLAAEPVVLQGHTRLVTSVAFSPDGRYALTGSADRTVRLWDVITGDTIVELKGHTHWVISVAFSPDGRYALTESDDNSVCQWDLEYTIKDLNLEQLVTLIKVSQTQVKKESVCALL